MAGNVINFCWKFDESSLERLYETLVISAENSRNLRWKYRLQNISDFVADVLQQKLILD